MPTSRRRLLRTVPLACLASRFPARAQGQFAEPFTLEALMARLAAVPERRARFREERRLAALDQPLLSEGRLYWRRPDRLERVTEWPEPETVVVEGGRASLTIGGAAPRVLDLNAAPDLRVLLDGVRAPLAGDLAALRRSFEVALTGGWTAWELVLTPREDRARRLLRVVRVRGSGDTPRETVAEQSGGDVQRLWIEPVAR